MSSERIIGVLVLLLMAVSAFSLNTNDSTLNTKNSILNTKSSIYNGTQIKLDIASPIVIAGINDWKIQHYEIATNVRLAQRYYPTVELGYSGGTKLQGDTLTYKGQGGFIRVGADINPLKKHPERPHALLIGLRIGTAVHDWNQTVTDKTGTTSSTNGGVRGDCWGEIIAGCQVCIAEGPVAKGKKTMAFYMGWMGRFKFLFTRNLSSPIYIPGYGERDNIGWGLNYYLGWRF